MKTLSLVYSESIATIQICQTKANSDAKNVSFSRRIYRFV